MSKTKLRLEYDGSIFWLIFWTICFFPIALILLIMRSRFTSEGKTFTVDYDGSIFWLCFWLLVFFPVAIVLCVVNGLGLEVEAPKLIEQ